MILPHNDSTLILLMALCLLCWGSWASLFKSAKKYRFELFYFDFGFGLAIAALICALTFGSLGYDGLPFTGDLMYARKQEWLYGFLAAVIFNLGNMLTLASVSVAGMAVAFPLSFGAAMIVGGWMSYMSHPGTSAMVMLAGTVFMLLSVILNSSAYSQLRILQHETVARAGKAKSTRRPSSIKGIALALVGGCLMGVFAPLLRRAQDAVDGVGPYSMLFIFSGAVVVSTFVFNLFFMNLPVEGDPLEIVEYFNSSLWNHVRGFAAGAIWGIGALASFVAATPKGTIHPSIPLGPILSQSAPLLAALWGVLIWKEFKGGDMRVKVLAAFMLVLFASGVVAFSCAPLFSNQP